MKKDKWGDTQKQKERALKHNCDGRCYWGPKYDEKTGDLIESGGMCGRAEICEETRKGEFFATVIAAIVVAPAMLIMWLFDKITNRKGKK